MKLIFASSALAAICMNAIPTAHAFTIPSARLATKVASTQTQSKTVSPSASQTSLMMSSNENESKKKKGGIDSATRSRLLSESIAPWRTIRLFLYFALGSGATLGGFITATGVAAYLSGARSDLDINTEYLNLAIDFGAVAVFALLARWDIGKADELNERVNKKLQEKKDNKVIRKAMKEREQTLSKLKIEIRVSEDGQTQTAPVEAVQTGGKQHVIVVAGPRKAIRDALLGANILKMEFSIRDVLIVPYELGKTQRQKEDEAKLRPDGKGFGGDSSRPTWETQPYVAQPVGEGWDEYIKAELDDAVKQNGEKVKEDGIAIVAANSGEIIRRGVGQVPWRNMVEELENAVKDDELLDLGFLQG
jgi:hypothetical protein